MDVVPYIRKFIFHSARSYYVPRPIFRKSNHCMLMTLYTWLCVQMTIYNICLPDVIHDCTLCGGKKLQFLFFVLCQDNKNVHSTPFISKIHDLPIDYGSIFFTNYDKNTKIVLKSLFRHPLMSKQSLPKITSIKIFDYQVKFDDQNIKKFA